METTIRPRTVLIASLVVLAVFAVAVVGLVVALLTARSASAAPSAGTALAAVDSPTANTITVSGTGVATGTPDTLVLSMGVSVTADTVDVALKQANEAATKVHKALKDSGVESKDLQTTGLSVQARYNSNGDTITGYTVSESVVAKLRGIDKMGAAISSATQAGGSATRVDGISLDLSDTSALLEQARVDAVKAAKAKAGQYADAADRNVGDLVSLSESVDYSPKPFAERAFGADSAASSVPIEAGSREVSVTISAVFALK